MRTGQELLEDIKERNPEALMADGLEDAVIGMARRAGMEVIAYSYEKCLEVLERDQGMQYESAVEWMEFNVVGAYVGEQGPVFIET